MFYYDPLWLVFAIPGLLLGLYAQIKLSHSYNKYMQVPVSSGLSGAEAARQVLNQAGLKDVPIEEIPGHLTDRYDPTKRALEPQDGDGADYSICEHGVSRHFHARLGFPFSGLLEAHLDCHRDLRGHHRVSTDHPAG